MENTVVGLYDSYTQAQNVVNELHACGFSEDEVLLGTEPGRLVDSQAAAQDHQSGSRIGHFFRSLFGMEDEEDRQHHDIYAEAMRRGGCVVIAHAASELERERAIEVMNRFDAVDIDERASQWRSEGWTGCDEAGPAFTDSEIEKEMDTPSAMPQAEGEPARSPDIEEDARAGKRAAQKGGVRVYRRTAEIDAEQLGAAERSTTGATTAADMSIAGGSYADTAMTSDDSDYRTHWQNAYGASGGSYEDFDAAYRYGSTAAGSERYRNYRWEEAEPALRSDWERDHPESAWDMVKDAVRYGAERVTGQQQRP